MKQKEQKKSDNQRKNEGSPFMYLFLPLFIGWMLFACSNHALKNKTMELPRCFVTNPRDQILDTLPKNVKPVYGYRYLISGDFDGDGKHENLMEHYHSGLTRNETNKFYSNLVDFAYLVELTVANQPYSFLLSTTKYMDTLHISSNEQLLGISYLKNEGDLNDDGTDEISFVVDYADWSSVNSCHVMTYKNNHWNKLYSFEIRDWQLPSLPECNNQYGLFGIDKKIISKDWKENRKIEKERLAFEGLLKKVKSNQIEINCIDQEGAMVKKKVNLKSIRTHSNSPPSK